jgi:hypothetical protein
MPRVFALEFEIDLNLVSVGWYGQEMNTQIDHLVVAAQTLELGVQWCEVTLGVTAGAGCEYAQFGTHSHFFKIATPAHPLAYFEIVAIDSQDKRTGSPSSKCWFDMDDAKRQAAVAVAPQLVHFVVNTDDMQTARAALI